MNVTIYTTPTCGYCHQAKRYLAERGVNYAEHDVSQDRAAAQEMMRLTGQMGVPVIVVNGKPIIGFDRAKLESMLAGGGDGHRPRFGIKIADASKIANKSGVIPVFGALVGAVSKGSLGEKAGLQAEDIITELNLRPINNAGDFENAIAGLGSGNRVAITFLRGEKTLRSEITV